MKKIVLLMIAIVAFAFATKAQNFGFQKGDVILEGSVGGSLHDDKNTEIKTSNLNLKPKAGYFVSDKFAIGIAPGYNQSKTTNYSGSQDTYTKTNTVSVELFGRYYFLEAGTRFKFYSELDLGYSSMGGETSNGSTTTKMDKTNGAGAGVGIGANYFITKKIAIGYQFSNILGFATSKMDTNGAKAVNSFYANLNSFSNFFDSGQFSLTFKL